jgi:hypothetical protein
MALIFGSESVQVKYRSSVGELVNMIRARKIETREVSLAENLLRDLRGKRAGEIAIRVITHFRPDADAILSSALAIIAVNGANIEFSSSDDSVGEDQSNCIGVDVARGPRSIKGRDSSAAEVVARAMLRMGWHFDSQAMALVEEVTAIDSAKGGQRAWLNFGSLTQNLRDAGWGDLEIIDHVVESLSAHLISPGLIS